MKEVLGLLVRTVLSVVDNVLAMSLAVGVLVLFAFGLWRAFSR
jgi:uncharacterized membrane protein